MKLFYIVFNQFSSVHVPFPPYILSVLYLLLIQLSLLGAADSSNSVRSPDPISHSTYQNYSFLYMFRLPFYAVDE